MRVAKTIVPLVACWVLTAFATLAQAELRFTDPVVNKGEVFSGQRVAERFHFVNTGPHPITILDIHTGCGCLKPILAQRTFAPGEEGTLFLELNTLAQPAGPHAWQAQVRYQEGPWKADVAVEIDAVLQVQVTVDPPALNLIVEKGVGHDLVVTDIRSKPLKLAGASATSPHILTQVRGSSTDAKGHVRRTVHLEVTGDFPEGRHDEIVTIYTSDPGYPELKVPVTITKRGSQRVLASPARVDLSAASGQPFPSRIVLIRDAEGKQVVIDKVHADDPALVCRWAPGPNTMATLKIQVDENKLKAGSLESTIHVEVKGPVQQTVVIPVSCHR